MAPGRKRGANSKGNATSELSCGDLVLAKVKGFPAWPAKVSRPKDWERTPDPTKYFVQFFGTQETAFVAQLDILPFTNESRSKLRNKCKGKTIKFFPQAVDEICEAFKELEQNKTSSPGDDVVCKPHVSFTVGGMETNGAGHGLEAITDAAGNHSSLENCSVMPQETDTKKINSIAEIKSAREGVSKCNLASPSHVKVETIDRKKNKDVSTVSQCTKSGRATSSSPSRGDSFFSSKRDVSSQSGSAIRKRVLSGKTSIEAHKSKEIGEQKRKLDSAVSQNNHAKSSGHLKDETPRKISSDSNNQEPSPTKYDPQKDGIRSSEDYAELELPKQVNPRQLDSERRSVPIPERSDLFKRTKHSNLVSDASKSSSLKNGNRDSSSLSSPHGLLEKKSENKILHMEAEGQMEFKLQKVLLASNVAGDVAALPSAKRHHGIVSSVVSNSSVSAFDDKKSLLSSFPRSDVTKKRRAIRLDGDDEDDIRKTPVHGYSVHKAVPSFIPNSPQTKVHMEETVDKSEKLNQQSPNELDKDKQLLGELFSPKKSSTAVVASDKKLEEQSGKRHQVKFSGSHLVKKSGHISSGEKPITLKSQRVGDSVESGRGDEIRKDTTSTSWDSKITDSEKSMKNLIAAAQAKRRQAQVQGLSQSNMVSANIATQLMRVKNSSPSAGQQLMSRASTNIMQENSEDVHCLTSFMPPSDHAPQLLSQNQDKEEHMDKRPSSGHQGDGSLSGGTEAAVARDAFEGMIETLSRTKESIGRATRLAVDCAKYGIATEVVDLLIRKLESESSCHRKVDLFFLVDSITQCSHSQKGIAGASYIPVVQAALPRLLGAAAPAGANARENRRQCLKVLRLWHERKILPESLLTRYMDDIRASNDDVSSGISYRRPSRAERAVDDPLREMEGMLVDEYGSNATFQLPGIFSSHAFDENGEDEEDILGTSCIQSAEEIPVEPHSCVGAAEEVPMEPAVTVIEPEAGILTPNDKHHHILEDVDVELEMEEVSGFQKEDLWSRGLSMVKYEQGAERENDQITYYDAELLTPEGSPPLPLEPAPTQPPLPTSPPPPLPPLSPPLPPPPPPSQTYLTSLPPLGLSSSMHPQLQPQSSFPSEILSQPKGNQMVQLAISAPQQSTCFIQAGTNGPQNPSFSVSRPLEYGHSRSDIYIGGGSLAAQPSQQFQPTHVAFPRGSFVPPPPPQTHGTSNQFTFIKPTVQQHSQHQYPHPYASQSFPDNRTRTPADEHWTASGEYKADNQHGIWTNNGRAPSYSTKPFGAEGYFRPPLERPPPSNIVFPAPNSIQSVFSTPGNINSQILPSRPDMSALNSWRPA